MIEESFLRPTLLLFALLNPFLMSVYLLDLIEDLDARTFASVLSRASAIAGAVFVLVAWGGEAFFTDVLQVSFASFQVFGGLIFVFISARMLFVGPDAIRGMRGEAEHLAGSVAMPFMVGPGTLSASVVVGESLDFGPATLSIVLVLFSSFVLLVLFKAIHDRVRRRHARLIERYSDVVGRLSALFMGTIAVEMILVGLSRWQESGVLALGA
jgi:small neutral amino acid transporter SnatA (MarC family)